MNQKINVSNVEKQQKVDVENKQTITTTIEQTGKSPYVGENGNWFQYDDKQSLFVDTGVKVQGESGKNATINGLEVINIIGGENIDLVQQGNDFYINYNGTQMNVEVVEELPSEGVSGKIYLMLKETNTNNDIYDEYLYINGVWEHIGSTAVNLTDYYTKEEIDVLIENNNSTVIGDLNSLETEDKNNMVSALNEVFNLASQSGGGLKTIQLVSNFSSGLIDKDTVLSSMYKDNGVYFVKDEDANGGILVNSTRDVSMLGGTITYQFILWTHYAGNPSGEFMYRRITSSTATNSFSRNSIIPLSKVQTNTSSSNSFAVRSLDSKAIINYVGNINNLKTTAKTNIVNAINELKISLDEINTNLGSVNEILATLTTVSEVE